MFHYCVFWSVYDCEVKSQMEESEFLFCQFIFCRNVISNDDEANYLTFSGFESVYHPKLNCDDDEGDNTEPGAESQLAQQATSFSDNEILEFYRNTSSMASKMTYLQTLYKRHGPAFVVQETSIRDCVQELYTQACYIHNWSVVRQGATLLEKTVASLAPSITTMLVAGKQVSFGKFEVSICFYSFCSTNKIIMINKLFSMVYR